ncbi:hypothetical protein K7N18_34780 [Burkholderia arboris]|uniref:hypothetical protein n=1 Tax=Burkholderia arboris TaxID=488730 RepID=UPI001CA3920E|nr:hypothetical protein [Burkholderia arboris]MBY8609988.1 hypothetical protein [Burkholderia arboris]
MANDAATDTTMHTPDATRSRTLYLIGFAALAPTIILLLALKQGAWYTITLEAISAISFGLGFCIRARPILANSARTIYGKGLLALYHAIVLALSSIPAKYIVSDAFQLPSGDFPITLTLWTLLCYPGTWLAGTALLALAIYTLMLLAAMFATISTHPTINLIITTSAKFLPSNSTLRISIANDRKQLIWAALGHAAGAAVLAILISTVAAWWLQTIHQPRIVRLFAYVADYEKAAKYPGVDSSVPFRLHDNGVVSYATFNKWDIIVRVSHVTDVK